MWMRTCEDRARDVVYSWKRLLIMLAGLLCGFFVDLAYGADLLAAF